MKLMVTGASGLIGKAFIDLYSTEYNLTALTRKISSTLNDNINWVETDYTVDSLSKVLSGADAVIHMAGIRLPPPNEDNFLHYLDNITISENIFKACVNNSIMKIVCASTRSVYSELNKTPWIESDTAIPASLYGASKLAMESIASIYSKKYKLNIKCLRIAQILSANERKGYLLRTLFDRAKANEEQIIFGTGEGKREYIYVKDAARSFLHAVQSNEHYGNYNIGTDYAISIKELAEQINKTYGCVSPVKYLTGKQEDLNKSLMDCSKAAKYLNFQADFTIEDAIKDIYCEMKK
ncbi:MAG: NAD(P)-dependent oxidoreductase [Oscillospiraceae bacterium]|nr:NAD(P)-dependent oxidoreductase [Oscillospiraceae bacterium]